jgi:hypothetical protein
MDKYLVEKQEGKPRLFRIAKIKEFIELATWISSDGQVVFRGQRRDRPLIPSIGRDKESKRWFYVEKEVFEEFKREAVPYLEFSPQNNWQWLSVAQHKRLPTRLLDWTKNPLVALWFTVCSPAYEEKPGIVWAYIYEAKDAISSTTDLPSTLFSPFNIDRTYLYFPEHVFPSIQAQSGVFTIHHRQTENNEFVPFEDTKDADLLLSKIEIPADAFPTIRYHLFRLGITPSSLFPGISGLVERIKYINEPCKDEIKRVEET